MSSNYYVIGEISSDVGRVLVGTLHKGRLTISEARRFSTEATVEKGTVQWNIPQIYQEVMTGLQEIGVYEEPVDGISFTGPGADYLLFEADGSLQTPTFHAMDPRGESGMKEVLTRIPAETLYEETGLQLLPTNTLSQLASEKPKRLKRANLILPIADAFHYLLSGVPRVEMSSASTTQLFNPVTRNWSERILADLKIPAKPFAPLVPAGTKLGQVRSDVVNSPRLQEAQVIAGCSLELSSMLAGLPVEHGENWAWLRCGVASTIGTSLIGPIICDASHELGFNNFMGYGGAVHFSRQVVGLSILEECKRYWKEKDRELYDDVLSHLATSAEPFESLINPEDPRFLSPGDMPLKIQAFCKETNQAVPRKPGPILRCVLESLALHYRKVLLEIEALTGRQFSKLYLFGAADQGLLHHFIANALQIPVVLAPPESTGIGNAAIQALALGHIKSIDEAREIIRNSFKTETITPHAAVWNAAYDRLSELVPS
ncbi:MAG: FGGY family carbohydrate kinase [Verrucomicrobiota bacterium]